MPSIDLSGLSGFAARVADRAQNLFQHRRPPQPSPFHRPAAAPAAHATPAARAAQQVQQGRSFESMGLNPLQHSHFAAVNLDRKQMSYALGRGISINQASPTSGNTLLMKVVTSDHGSPTSMVTYMMGKRDANGHTADPRIANREGDNALHLAAARNDLHISRELIEPLRRERNGHQRGEALQLLNARNDNGLTPMQVATRPNAIAMMALSRLALAEKIGGEHDANDVRAALDVAKRPGAAEMASDMGMRLPPPDVLRSYRRIVDGLPAHRQSVSLPTMAQIRAKPAPVA